jgi:beta-glucosidase
MMNLARVPEGGRNWEGPGADPFLAGVHAVQNILGIQSKGVIACAKH